MAADGEHSQRLLVRGVNWLGDAVMSTPAMQRLREARPSAHITLLTPEKLAGLWEHHPALDAILTFSPRESVFGLARRLRARGFSTALVLPNSPRSALEACLAGVPERIGYRRPWRNLFLTRTIDLPAEAVSMRRRSAGEIKRLVASPRQSPAIPPGAHHLYHYLHLAAALGAKPEPLPPMIAVSPEEVSAIRNRFRFDKGSSAPRLLFGLNAGAEYGPAKRWPRQRFVEAAQILQRRTGCGWWIFGAPAEREMGAALATEIQTGGQLMAGSARSLAGQTTLRELCAAMKCCDLMLSNDSGPMHLAAAVGTRVVALFGSTSPELTGPGLPGDKKHRVLRVEVPCAPCFRRECPIDFRCLEGLNVEKVVSAVEALLHAP